VFFIVAIIAFYSIGRTLVFLWFFSHHRFLQLGRILVLLGLSAIIAFYGIGRILVSLF
jgi:hypothetical protein